MLRACEFAGRLGIGIESKTQEAIHRHSRELEKASPARVTEEIIQLMKCGRAGAAMQWMLELDLLPVLLPEAYAMLSAGARGLGDFGQILPVIDRLVALDRPLSDTGLLAALLLPKVMLRRLDIESGEEGKPGRPMTRPEIEVMIQEEIAPFFQRLTLSNLRAQQVYHALLGFQRLCEPHASSHERLKLARKPYFDDSLLLFEILVQATGEGGEALAAWQAAARRRPPLKVPAESEARERPRRRRRRRPAL
jgi:tRNA nucleotidyltransferase/poly(A) polymerase